MDRHKIEQGVRLILEGLGEDLEREGLIDTPRRVADMYAEIFEGLTSDPIQELKVYSTKNQDEMILVKDISFHSMCLPSKELVNGVGGCKRARDVRPGDTLWTLQNGELSKTTVVAVARRKTKELCELYVPGRRLRLTPDHPVMTRAGWKPAGQVAVDDWVERFPPRRLAQRRYPIRYGYELGYVLGAVASDASIQDERRISLVVRERAFAQKYAAALSTAFPGLTPRLEEIEVPSGFLRRNIPMVRVRVVSGFLGRTMLRWFGGSKAARTFRLPRVILGSKEMVDGFLSGYADGDGHKVNSGGRMLISTNRTFLKELGEVVASVPSRPRRGGTATLYISAHWHEPGWYGRPGFTPIPFHEDRESEWTPVIAVRRVVSGRKPFTVYRFTCSPHPTFLAGGILLHNCEHHLLPFFGKVHLAYIPAKDRITGFSHLVRVVNIFSHRPQLQERLTTDIADALVKVLRPKGVLVVIEAEQMCLTMRGVKKLGTLTLTSAMRGILRQEATRMEAFSMIMGKVHS